jgi:hypothetical protein
VTSKTVSSLFFSHYFIGMWLRRKINRNVIAGPEQSMMNNEEFGVIKSNPSHMADAPASTILSYCN